MSFQHAAQFQAAPSLPTVNVNVTVVSNSLAVIRCGRETREAVQFSVFNRLTENLVQRLAAGPWNVVHRDTIQAAYKQAAEMPDLYRACLSDARTRQAHLSILSRYVEQNFRDRLAARGEQPRVPVPVMARAFVGAHVAILEAWLAGELDGDVEELARMTLDLLICGTAWAHGLRLDELGYSA